MIFNGFNNPAQRSAKGILTNVFMNVLKKISVICFIILSSCSLSEENLEINHDQVFYEKIAVILENPTSYSSLTPQKINPFDFDLNFKIEDLKKMGSRVQASESENSVLPLEIKNANKEFQELTVLLIQTAKKLDHKAFLNFAYAVELELLSSKLSDVKREFIFKELAVLKYAGFLKENSFKNARLMCDSQFECDLLACVDSKITAAPESATTYLEYALLIYDMPIMVPVYFASCAYGLLAG